MDRVQDAGQRLRERTGVVYTHRQEFGFALIELRSLMRTFDFEAQHHAVDRLARQQRDDSVGRTDPLFNFLGPFHAHIEVSIQEHLVASLPQMGFNEVNHLLIGLNASPVEQSHLSGFDGCHKILPVPGILGARPGAIELEEALRVYHIALASAFNQIAPKLSAAENGFED